NLMAVFTFLGLRFASKCRPLVRQSGMSELARATFSSDGQGKKLDTDFVVGCALKYLERELRAKWYSEDIFDDPSKEEAICRERHPLIRDEHTQRIYEELKCPSEGCGWNITRKTGKTLEQRREVVQQAEEAVFKVLRKRIPVVSQ